MRRPPPARRAGAQARRLECRPDAQAQPRAPRSAVFAGPVWPPQCFLRPAPLRSDPEKSRAGSSRARCRPRRRGLHNAGYCVRRLGREAQSGPVRRVPVARSNGRNRRPLALRPTHRELSSSLHRRQSTSVRCGSLRADRQVARAHPLSRPAEFATSWKRRSLLCPRRLSRLRVLVWGQYLHSHTKTRTHERTGLSRQESAGPAGQCLRCSCARQTGRRAGGY